MATKHKQADEARERAERQQAQRTAKAARRGQEPDLRRQVNTRAQRPIILIVREGENTEKDYFKQFRLATHTFEFAGAGTNTQSLVRAAQREQAKGRYAQVWCVFDKDSFPPDNFDNAIRQAEAAGFKVGWSNQAFEYWLLLHFEDHQGSGMDRRQYHDKLNGYLSALGVRYEGTGSKTISSQLFSVLEGRDEQGRPRRALATERARRNHQAFIAAGSTPARSESCTTVYVLMDELKKLLPTQTAPGW